MEYQNVLFEVRDQVAFVTFNRPESMNAVNRAMAQELVDACNRVEEDPGIRVAIFNICAGWRIFRNVWGS